MEDDEFVVAPFPGCDMPLTGPEIRITSHEPSPLKGQEEYTGPSGCDLGIIRGKGGQRTQNPHFLKLPNDVNTVLYSTQGCASQPMPTPSCDYVQKTSGPGDRRPTSIYIRHITDAGPAGNEATVPDTQLGLTNDEIALLRRHQREAASLCGSSSRVCSSASSQGLLVLDGQSLAMLSRHFDRLLGQIQHRLDHLSEQVQMCAQQSYDKAGNLVANADLEIAHLQSVLEKMDKLELEFDKIRNIRDIVRDYRSRIEALDQALTLTSSQTRASPSPPPSGENWQIAIPMLDAFRNLLSKPRQDDEEGMKSCASNAASENGSTETTSAGDTETTYDSESEFSDDWCTPVDWQHHYILEAVMAEFYALFNQLHGHRWPGVASCSPNAEQSSSSGTGSLSSGYQQSSTSYSSNSQGSKRSNEDGSFPPPDEKDDGNKRPRMHLSSSGDDSSNRRFACPFFKHNPIKYSQKGSCTGPGFRSISHLKEHLYRCHMVPIQCPRCWIEVGEGNGLEIHLNGDTQCQRREPQPAEGVCPRKFKLLKSKKRVTGEPGDEARWRDVFRILFPGVQPIPSPYYERVTNTAATSISSNKLGDFRQYSQTRLPSLIETHVGRILERELQPLEARIKSMVQDITRKCLSDLVRDWQTSEFANPGSYQSASQAAGEIHEAYSPHHPTDLAENPSLGENSDLNTRNRQSEMLIPSNTNSSFNHLHFLQSVEDNNVGTQNEEWMYRTTFDLAMCTDFNPFLVGPSISGAPFCLEVPPHPDPQKYDGKGKEPENISIGGQDFLCAICFPGT